MASNTTIISKAAHCSVKIDRKDNVSVMAVRANGTRITFDSVTCVYGAYAGGTISIRSAGRLARKFKLVGSPNYHNRNVPGLTGEEIVNFVVIDKDHNVYDNVTTFHKAHDAYEFAMNGSVENV